MNLELLPPRNRLLQSLPKEDFALLRPRLELVPLNDRRALHPPGIPFRHVYFVERGLVAVLAKVGGERAVEVWLVGREGFTGIPIVLGMAASAHFRVIQVPGIAYRIDAADLIQAMNEIESLRPLLLRYVHAVLVETSQSGACNASHQLIQRVVRWLLNAQAKCEEETLPFSNETLARMLGVRRASVSECVGNLEREGILEKRGRVIRIADRRRLEALACDCHRVIASEFARIDTEHMSQRSEEKIESVNVEATPTA